MDGLWTHARRRWPFLALAYLVAWTIPGLITTTQLSISYGMRGDSPDLALLLKVAMPGWYIWAVLAPGIVWAAWRFPFHRVGWPGALLLHLGLNAVAAAAWVGLAVTVRRLFGLPGSTDFMTLLVNAVGTSLLTYWVLVLAVHAARFHLEGRDRAMRTAHLAAELSDARLQALTARLHPHFLFNTMHAISAFVRSQPDKAETMLAQLADLLRMVLDAPDADIVPLRRELDFAERYLALQQVRLDDRLALSFDVSGPIEGVGVPILLIQPLIENAVEHGVASRRGAGRVAVRCEVSVGRVAFEIRDDGPGLPEGFDPRHEGRIGLGTTAARLRARYGADHRFEVHNHPDGGVVARVEVPVTALPVVDDPAVENPAAENPATENPAVDHPAPEVAP